MRNRFLRFKTITLISLFISLNNLILGDNIEKDYLLKAKFISDDPIYEEIKFINNTDFEFSYDAFGNTWYIKGKYQIKDNKINIFPKICKDYREKNDIECKKTIGNGNCYLKNDNDSIFYSKYINCKSIDNEKFKSNFEDGLTIPNINTEIKAGLQKKIKVKDILNKYGEHSSIIKNNRYHSTENVSVDVITMGRILGSSKANIKFRNMPDKNSQFKKYLLNYDDNISLNYIPKGTQLHIYARTIKKDKIDNFENYWYYVYAGD